MTLGTTGCNAELANTLTHELGHLHGLEHTCLASGDPPRTDGDGNPVPSCSATSDPKITEATMYPFQDCGETKKETLEPDDIAAICTIYPTAKDPHTCSAVNAGGTGCNSSGGPFGAAHCDGPPRPARTNQNSTRALAQVFCSDEWRHVSRLRGGSRSGLREVPEVPSLVASLQP